MAVAIGKRDGMQQRYKNFNHVLLLRVSKSTQPLAAAIPIVCNAGISDLHYAQIQNKRLVPHTRAQRRGKLMENTRVCCESPIGGLYSDYNFENVTKKYAEINACSVNVGAKYKTQITVKKKKRKVCQSF